MLVDPDFATRRVKCAPNYAEIEQREGPEFAQAVKSFYDKIHENIIRLEQGVYQTDDFNFSFLFRDSSMELDYPKFRDIYEGNWFNCYGVCDSPEQLLARMPKEVRESEIEYVISLVKLEKKNEEPYGWRWHKWGPYIGDQEPTTEYLFDEPVIEVVWVYHIMRVK